MILGAVTALGFGMAMASNIWTLSYGKPLMISLSALLMLMYAYLMYRDVRKPWLINLNHRHEPNFFKRHKDKFIWSFLGGAVMLFFKYLASLFE